MIPANTDYDALKKRGFLKQKQDGFFVVRVKMPHGVFRKEHLDKLAYISEKYAKGFIHTTIRQGIEVPFIKHEDVPQVEAELKAGGIEIGASGPRIRTTTCCPGNNWCRFGLVDTFLLYDRIERELGVRCGLDLPHKFKIAISGCPNGCSRPQQSEIGIHGTVEVTSGEKRIGYAVYLGGCAGRTPRIGFKLDGLFTEDQVLRIVANVVKFFKENAEPRQRLALLIEEFGREGFLKVVL